MEYYVKSVVPIIESNYDKFTTVERNIADFFIQNRKKVDFSSKSCNPITPLPEEMVSNLTFDIIGRRFLNVNFFFRSL